jgi:hypothetical protein
MNILTMPLTMQAWEWLVVCVVGNLAYCACKDLCISAKALIHKINLRRMHKHFNVSDPEDEAIRITITPAAVHKAMGQNQDLNRRKVNMQPTNTPPPVSPEWLAEQWKIYKESK